MIERHLYCHEFRTNLLVINFASQDHKFISKYIQTEFIAIYDFSFRKKKRLYKKLQNFVILHVCSTLKVLKST
jgi:hypothetical protein